MNEAHTYQKYIKSIGEVLIPFAIYYALYFLALIGLTSLVITILQGAGESWQSLLLEQETTVNAVIGGFSMMIGIVPLFHPPHDIFPAGTLEQAVQCLSPSQIRQLQHSPLSPVLITDFAGSLLPPAKW